ncbi:MAG: hypothetical protein ABMB14_17525 [Myxococcota bacterium]
MIAGIVACHAEPDGAGTGDDDDGTGDGNPTTAPPIELGDRCADPGPDAPVVPRIEPTASTFEGFDVETYLPDGLRGVVFYFYGGDTVVEWNGYEQTAFANQMYDAGVGFVVTDRTVPGNGAQWDDHTLPIDANDDLARLERLRQHLIDTTPLEADTPIVSAGFSDGAAFSVFFATVMQQRGWPITVLLVHNSGAGGTDLPDVPIWTTAAAHDEGGTRAGAEQIADEQRKRGFDATFTLVEERTLTPDVFLRNPEWDDEKTAEVWADIVGLGLIDDSGARLPSDAELEPALSAYGKNSTFRGSAIVESRIRVAWATHRYSALYTADECAFALDALGL